MHTPPSVLWNQGGLVFRKETLDVDGSRAVNAVDVDGDGRLDLVFTHAGNRPSLWRTDVGLAPPAFQRVPPRQFIGRYNPYSIAWADLDDDTDLDMVGASYNAELMARGFGTPSGGGVFLFTNEGGALKPDLLVHAHPPGPPSPRIPCPGAGGTADRPGWRRAARHPGRLWCDGCGCRRKPRGRQRR